MRDYYEYTVIYKECKNTGGKHTSKKEKDVPCKKVTEEGQPMRFLVNRMPWGFGSTSVLGTYWECGENRFRLSKSVEDNIG